MAWRVERHNLYRRAAEEQAELLAGFLGGFAGVELEIPYPGGTRRGPARWKIDD